MAMNYPVLLRSRNAQVVIKFPEFPTIRPTLTGKTGRRLVGYTY